MQYNIYLYFQTFFFLDRVFFHNILWELFYARLSFCSLTVYALPLNDTEGNVKHVFSPVCIQIITVSIHISTVVEQWRPTLHDKRDVTLNTVVSDVRHYYSFWKPSGGHHLSKLDSRLPGIYDLRSAKISQLVFFI